MSERKVLNKYYPPDFDPSKIPRMKLPKNRQYTVRLMAPCNMRCKTCGEYIYKGKKFNARKEDVEGEDYLGIRIYRFYIKCTRCLQEISFKTDPRNTDYEIEAGATRNFMALKLAEEQAQREEDERKEEEATNPMKLLENRTQQSKQELELLESLEELKDLNRRQQSIDYDSMLLKYNDKEARKKLEELQKEEDERMVKAIYGTSNKGKRVISEEIVEDIDDDEIDLKKNSQEPPMKQFKSSTTSSSSSNTSSVVKPPANPPVKSSAEGSWNKSVGLMTKSSKSLSGLVKKKPLTVPSSTSQSTAVPSVTSVTAAGTQANSTQANSTQANSTQASNGLALLGSYSDSGSDSDT